VRDLLHLLIAERIVLLYSLSPARAKVRWSRPRSSRPWRRRTLCPSAHPGQPRAAAGCPAGSQPLCLQHAALTGWRFASERGWPARRRRRPRSSHAA